MNYSIIYLVGLILSLSGGVSAPRPVAPPILGAWEYRGTAPPGFVRHGPQVARLTLTLRQGRLQALVLTGAHRYKATGQYSAARRELRVTVRTGAGAVRLDATLLTGNARMIGTWSDTRGDDGGFVLVRLPARPTPRRR